MSATVTRFQQITKRVTATGKCPTCGKSVRRSETLSMTVNPFNRNADGEIKSPLEVEADLEREAAEWQPDFRHGACREAQR